MVETDVGCGEFGKLMAVRYKGKEELSVNLYVECDKCNMEFEKEAFNVRHQSLVQTYSQLIA